MALHKRLVDNSWRRPRNGKPYREQLGECCNLIDDRRAISPREHLVGLDQEINDHIEAEVEENLARGDEAR